MNEPLTGKELAEGIRELAIFDFALAVIMFMAFVLVVSLLIVEAIREPLPDNQPTTQK